MAEPIPVDFDPFAETETPAPTAAPKAAAPKPVDFDPFAEPPKDAPAPAAAPPAAPAKTVKPAKGAKTKEPKPDLSSLQAGVMVFPDGSMVFADPKAQEEFVRSQGSLGAGAASGAAQGTLAVPQLASRLTPGTSDLDDWFAEQQQKLKKIGDPGAQKVGEALPYLFGGAALRALKYGGEAIAGAAGELPGMARLGEALAPVGEFLAPAGEAISSAGEAISSGAKTAASYLPEAKSLVPETVKKGWNWLKGTAPEAEAAAAKTAQAGVTGAPQSAEALAKAEDAVKGLGEMFKEGVVFTGKEVAKGAISGGAIGAGQGAIAPRAEKTQAERDQARWNDVIHGLGWGIGLGGLVGAGGVLIAGAKPTWSSMDLTTQKQALAAAEEALEKQRSAVSGIAGEAITREGDRITAATAAQQQAEAALTPKQQQIDELARLQTEARRRELYEGTDAQAREIAGKTNLTPRQAEAFVAEQNRILAEAEAAAEKELLDQASGQTSVTKVAAGEAVVPKAEKLKADLEEHRKKVSGLSELDAIYDAKGAVFPTEPMLSAIKSEIEGAKSGVKGNPTVNYLTRLYTRIEDTAKEFGGLTRKQLEDIRLEVKDAVNNGIIDSAGGVRRAGADLKKLEPVTNSITKSFDAVDTRYTSALKNYGTLSEALAPFEQKMGVFTGTTEKFYGVTPEMLPRDVINQIIDRTEGGGAGLKTLVDANPEIKEKLHGLLHGELFGPSKETAREVTAKKLAEFNRDRAEVLKSTGLTEEFANLESARRAAEQRIAEAEKGVKEAGTLEASTKKERELESNRRSFERGELEKSAAPDVEARKKALAEIERAEDYKYEYETLKKVVDRTAIERLPTVLENQLLALRNKFKTVDRDVLEIEKFDEALKKITDAAKEYKRTGDALKLAQNLKTYGIVKVASQLGIGLGGYGLYQLGTAKDH